MVGLVWRLSLCPQSSGMCGQGNGHMVEDLAVLHARIPLKHPQGSGQLSASGPDVTRLMEHLETGPQT